MSKIKEYQEVKSDPICGNCGKLFSEHYFENEVFCFHDTTGDIYANEPDEQWVLEKLAEQYPELYDKVVNKWKVDNGHTLE